MLKTRFVNSSEWTDWKARSLRHEKVASWMFSLISNAKAVRRISQMQSWRPLKSRVPLTYPGVRMHRKHAMQGLPKRAFRDNNSWRPESTNMWPHEAKGPAGHEHFCIYERVPFMKVGYRSVYSSKILATARESFINIECMWSAEHSRRFSESPRWKHTWVLNKKDKNSDWSRNEQQPSPSWLAAIYSSLLLINLKPRSVSRGFSVLKTSLFPFVRLLNRIP